MSAVHLLFGATPYFYASSAWGAVRTRKPGKWRDRKPNRAHFVGNESVAVFCGVHRLGVEGQANLFAMVDLKSLTRDPRDVTCANCRVFLDGWLERGKALIANDGTAHLMFLPSDIDMQRMGWQANEAWLHLPRPRPTESPTEPPVVRIGGGA